MYVKGTWTKGTGTQTIDVLNPGNSEVIATIPRGTKRDINDAVAAAREAFDRAEWKQVKPFACGEMLFAISEKMTQERDEVATLEATEDGEPLEQAYAAVYAAIRYFRLYGGAADKVMGDTIPIQDGLLDYVVREPVGVTAHIGPWNYPLQIISRS